MSCIRGGCVMPEFWTSSGYRLLGTDSDGRLVVTDGFLRSFLLRPELAPVVEAKGARLIESPVLGKSER